MQDSICPFGPAFRRERMEHGVSQWTVATRLRYHLRNIQRIEGGTQQPGVLLAVRLVVAVEANPGDFFQDLSEEVVGDMPGGKISVSCAPVLYRRPEPAEGVKCFFGPLLAQARLAGAVSQTAMAKLAGYNLRNVNAVEKGRQEPGIIPALRLVAATGADIRCFFNQFCEFSDPTFER